VLSDSPFRKPVRLGTRGAKVGAKTGGVDVGVGPTVLEPEHGLPIEIDRPTVREVWLLVMEPPHLSMRAMRRGVVAGVCTHRRPEACLTAC